MKTGQNGQGIIKAFESCLKRLPNGLFTTYRCPANVVTIGWGTTAADVPSLKEGEIWTQTRCDDVFAASLGKYEKYVNDLAERCGVVLDQNQFDALVSLAYNCGPGALNGSIRTALAAKKFADVPACMKRWNKAGGKVLAGLVRRRDAEALLFAGDVSGAFRVAGVSRAKQDPMPQKVDAGKPSAADASKKAAAPAVGVGAFLAAVWSVWSNMPLAMQIAAVLALCAAGVLAWVKVSESIRRMKENWS